MLLIFKKQTIYNCVFAMGLLLSVVGLFYGTNTVSPVSGTALTGKVIVVDAGHGTPDSGAIGYSGTKEKDLNLEIAKKTGDILQQMGAYVIYTREDDHTIADNLDDTIRNIKKSDMFKRKNIRDTSQADLFISIHMNIYSDSKYSGAQVFYNSGSAESKKLAQKIQSALKNNINPSNTREAKDSKNSIYILNGSNIPSVLVECGFISNPEEEKNLLSESYREEIAYAISSGIINYLSNT